MKNAFYQLKTRINLIRHQRDRARRLEIGPGSAPVQGFETLNIVGGRWVDYVCDASRRLPFNDNTFELVYASHILEHIPWHHCEQVLQEWVRIIAPEGRLEVWVPDGLKICRSFVEAEANVSSRFLEDGWFRFNDERDPCKWASGRIYTYGDQDGRGDLTSPNWHRALFSPRYLRLLLEYAGLGNVRQLDRSEVRGFDHGWINLGMTGIKP